MKKIDISTLATKVRFWSIFSDRHVKRDKTFQFVYNHRPFTTLLDRNK